MSRFRNSSWSLLIAMLSFFIVSCSHAPLPLTEKGVVGVWRVHLPISQNKQVEEEMNATTSWTYSLSPDHTFRSASHMPGASISYSGTWVFDERSQVLTLKSDTTDHLIYEPAEKKFNWKEENGIYWTKQSDSVPSLLRRPTKSVLRSSLIGTWQGKYTRFSHAPTLNYKRIKGNLRMNEMMAKDVITLELKADGTFHTEEELMQLPESGTWNYHSDSGIIQLTNKDMGTATQDLNVSDTGTKLTLEFSGNVIEFLRIGVSSSRSMPKP